MVAHSNIGASSAYRWIACPGSVRLSAGMPNEQNVHSAEGTAAHTLAQHCLEHGYSADRFLGWYSNAAGVSREKPDAPWTFEVTDDMAEAVRVYLDYARSVIEPADEWAAEQRLDLSAWHPGMFGTADLSIYKPAARKLVVTDYKHGRGLPVEAKDSPQGLYYALGAATRLHNRGLDEIEIVIVQPRCPHPEGPIRRWTVRAVDLLEWAADLVEAAKRTEAPDAPLAAGPHCIFCPAAPICPERERSALAAAQADFTEQGSVVLSEPQTYAPQEIARKLAVIGEIEAWCRRVREFAHHEAEAGRCPPGYKLVATRATRRWKDEQRALTELKDYGVPEDELYQRKFVSPAQAEKLIGRANKSDIAGLIESASSGTVLAPVDDPREAVKPEAARDFQPVEE